MKKFLMIIAAMSLFGTTMLNAQSRDTAEDEKKESESRLQIGGYGEAVYTRNFFSDKYLRYTDAETYSDDKSHGRFDLPHVVLWLGYDFGKGWSLGTELEIEHGGTESAVEIEEMGNDIRTGWCRTTPLWGRGLHQKCTGSHTADRLHDCRARTTTEAIMWHGNAKSDARKSVENYRNLSKADRDAIVKFIESI